MLIITVFHEGDAPLTTAALNKAGIAWIDYNVGRGVTEANWAAGMHLLEIGAVNEAGGPATPAITLYDEANRIVILGDHPERILELVAPDLLEGTAS